MATYPITTAGFAAIKKELEHLKKIERPAIIKAIAEARLHGDLSENAEYHAAKEELSFIEGRVEELEGIVLRAEVVGGNNKKGTIDIGCKVTVTLSGKEHTYEIVGEWEADPLNKKISHTSPLGQALVGKKIGENVEFEAPAGKVIYKIKKIH